MGIYRISEFAWCSLAIDTAFWQLIAPNLPPHAQMASPAVLSECERLVLQQEEALKCECQELEAWKLEVEC